MSVDRLLGYLKAEAWPAEAKLINTPAGFLLAYGLTMPADASEGYAPGCLFIHTDGTNGSALYVNEGTKASSDFNLIVVT